MKRYVHYLSLLLLTLTAIACSPNDESISPVTPHGAQPMRIEVTAQPFAPGDEEARTRGHDYYWGDEFRFEKDEQIGIIGIKNGTVIYNNYAYKYNGSSWSPVDDAKFCYFEQGMKYIAYYPYSSKMDGKKSKEEILAAFEVPTTQSSPIPSPLIRDEIDLMYSEVSPTTSTLSFEMEHALVLLLFPFPQAKLEWDGQTLYSTFDKNEISNPSFTVDGVKYTINMDNNVGNIKLLVKPGSNIKIVCGVSVNNIGYGPLSCESQVVLKANTSYTVRRKFKIPSDDMTKEGTKFCMRQSDNFGFPCPVANMPEGCIKIGTVAVAGSTAMKGAVMCQKDLAVSFENDNGQTEWATICNQFDYTPYNQQTYYTKSNSGKTADKWRGYVVSDFVYNGKYCTSYSNTSNDDVINALGGTRNPAMNNFSYQGFTRSYNVVNNTALRDKFPVFKPLYDVNSELYKQTPSNTSKWFLPGILEHNLIKSYFEGKTQWLTDYPTNRARYPCFVMSYNYQSWGLATVYNDAKNVKQDARYLLAF